MVTSRPNAIMNPSTSDGEGSHDSSGGVARSHKQREDYDDALVLATAMASGGAAAEAALQARSPPGDTGGTHHQYDGKRGDDDEDDEDYEDNDRDSASSSTDQQYQRYAYLDQPQFPSSPMVTPPIRSYEAAAAAAVAAASAASLSTAKTQHATTSSGMMQPQGVAGIPHIYHDYSQVPEDSSYIRKKTGGVTQPFPEKLQEMLRAVDGTEATGIVSWLPHGRAFLVRKPKEFTEVIMPKYFKQTKLTSFQRQLNLYGFRRITQGTDAGAYYHEMFLRARPGLCQRMARQKVKGTGHKQPADAKTEPNFYEMRPAEPAAPQGTAPHNFGAVEDQPQHQQQQEMSAPMEQLRSATTSAPARTNIVDAYSSPAWNYPQPPPGSILDSPASPGLHGAAHLLQGIASGFVSNLRIPSDISSLGPPAAASRGSTSDDGGEPSSSQPPNERRPASFLKPRLSSPSPFKKR